MFGVTTLVYQVFAETRGGVKGNLRFLHEIQTYIISTMRSLYISNGGTFQDLGKGLGKGLDKEKILANQIH